MIIDDTRGSRCTLLPVTQMRQYPSMWVMSMGSVTQSQPRDAPTATSAHRMEFSIAAICIYADVLSVVLELGHTKGIGATAI